MDVLEELLKRYQSEITQLRLRMDSLLSRIEVLEKSQTMDKENLRRIQSDIEIQMSYMSGIERAIFLTKLMMQDQASHQTNGLPH